MASRNPSPGTLIVISLDPDAISLRPQHVITRISARKQFDPVRSSRTKSFSRRLGRFGAIISEHESGSDALLHRSCTLNGGGERAIGIDVLNAAAVCL